MSYPEKLWLLLSEAMGAFRPFYLEAMENAVRDSGVPENWWIVGLARGATPAPFTVDRLHAMYPYTARERFADMMEELAGLEVLERVAPEAYRASGPGQEMVEDIFEVAQACMAPLTPLSAGEMDRLVSLLSRLLAATLIAAEPEEKWALLLYRWTDPGNGAPAPVRIDQHLTDLLRFRDDAHLAAWRSHEISGESWEALTFAWRGEARTAQDLVEKLPFRAHTVEVYERAYRDLVHRGWIMEDEGAYSLTERGLMIRDEAEAETDRLYFGPWACLSMAELEALDDLLTRLRDGLGRLAEASSSSQD